MVMLSTMRASNPNGRFLQRNQHLSRFHFKGRMNVAIILGSMQDPMMVKRSLGTFEIKMWFLVELFTFPCLADCVFFFLMCHDFFDNLFHCFAASYC